MNLLLPACLIGAALGLSLAFAPRGDVRWALAMLVAGLAIGLFTRMGLDDVTALRPAIWVTAGVTAAAALLPAGPPRLILLPLALNAGAWAGIAVDSSPLSLVALACIASAYIARWLRRRRWTVALRVAASWLATVAVLNTAMPLLTPTPGYVQDHME